MSRWITVRKKNIKNPPQTSKRSLREDLKYDKTAHQNIVFLLSGLALFFDYLENKKSFTTSTNFSAFDNMAGCLPVGNKYFLPFDTSCSI